MEIVYTNNELDSHYFKKYKVNGLYSKNSNYLKSLAIDLKEININKKMNVGVYLKYGNKQKFSIISELLKEFDIKKKKKQKLGELSTTELLKILTIKELVGNNETIILRSIDNYLNTRDLKRYFQILKNHIDKLRKTIIFETNNIDNLSKICSNILITDNNNVLFNGNNFDRLPMKTNLMKIADLANKKNAKLDYYKDVNDLLKAIYRSVSEKDLWNI